MLYKIVAMGEASLLTDADKLIKELNRKKTLRRGQQPKPVDDNKIQPLCEALIKFGSTATTAKFEDIIQRLVTMHEDVAAYEGILLSMLIKFSVDKNKGVVSVVVKELAANKKHNVLARAVIRLHEQNDHLALEGRDYIIDTILGKEQNPAKTLKDIIDKMETIDQDIKKGLAQNFIINRLIEKDQYKIVAYLAFYYIKSKQGEIKGLMKTGKTNIPPIIPLIASVLVLSSPITFEQMEETCKSKELVPTSTKIKEALLELVSIAQNYYQAELQRYATSSLEAISTANVFIKVRKFIESNTRPE